MSKEFLRPLFTLPRDVVGAKDEAGESNDRPPSHMHDHFMKREGIWYNIENTASCWSGVQLISCRRHSLVLEWESLQEIVIYTASYLSSKCYIKDGTNNFSRSSISKQVSLTFVPLPKIQLSSIYNHNNSITPTINLKMGELFDSLLGVAARSVLRHAVVGVLTGGVGNVLLAVGDLMDIHDTMDAVDAVSTVQDHSSGVHFGSGLGSDGLYHNDISGVSLHLLDCDKAQALIFKQDAFKFQSDWISNNQSAALVKS